MAFRSLSSLVSNAADLLALEAEELAGVLLAHLNSYEGVCGNSICQQGGISRHNFFNSSLPTSSPTGTRPEYGDQQSQVNEALMEAWAWLQSDGLLIERATLPGWFFVSRRARRMTSAADFEAYRKANLLPKGQLHPLIAGKVYSAFLRGEYDTAVFQSFREVEIAVREAGPFPADQVGVPLMRAAFGKTGPLTDQKLPVGEQEATGHLFAGAFGVYRNSTGHRNVPTDAAGAVEIIMLASQLLRIIDRLRGAQRQGVLVSG